MNHVATPDRDPMDQPEATGRTDVEQGLNFLADMHKRAERIESEMHVHLDPTVLDAFAQNERVARLTRLAQQSAGQLVPDAEAHRQINILLDEMGVVTEPWEHGRSLVSHRLEDD